jgi:hypothetical protein
MHCRAGNDRAVRAARSGDPANASGLLLEWVGVQRCGNGIDTIRT